MTRALFGISLQNGLACHALKFKMFSYVWRTTSGTVQSPRKMTQNQHSEPYNFAFAVPCSKVLRVQFHLATSNWPCLEHLSEGRRLPFHKLCRGLRKLFSIPNFGNLRMHSKRRVLLSACSQDLISSTKCTRKINQNK